jgi:hypothetical protein
VIFRQLSWSVTRCSAQPLAARSPLICCGAERRLDAVVSLRRPHR